jgi:hypothetical protein
VEKAIMWHTFKTSQNDDIQWIWSSSWEWLAVSGIIGRWSWFYLHIYAAKYVYFWILQRRLAWQWGAGVIHNIVLKRIKTNAIKRLKFYLQYFSYIIIFILRSFPHPNYNLNSGNDCCDAQLTALMFRTMHGW